MHATSIYICIYRKELTFSYNFIKYNFTYIFSFILIEITIKAKEKKTSNKTCFYKNNVQLDF